MSSDGRYSRKVGAQSVHTELQALELGSQRDERLLVVLNGLCNDLRIQSLVVVCHRSDSPGQKLMGQPVFCSSSFAINVQ